MSDHSHNPLAQFEIHPYLPLRLAGYDVSFTNASLWMGIVTLGIVMFLWPASRRPALVPGRLQSAGEVLVEFVRSTIRDVSGKEGLRYFPFIFTLFMFILFSNLFGMIPYSFTVTSHIVVTFAMAIAVFVGVTLIAIFKHGPFKFLAFFVPEGTPLWMAWLIFPIEFFSYLARPVSLSVRLAANMTAGHITLKVLGTLVVAFGFLGGAGMFLLLFFLTGFEFGIAVIQAYIFTLLTCVYLNDALHLH